MLSAGYTPCCSTDVGAGVALSNALVDVRMGADVAASNVLIDVIWGLVLQRVMC